MPFRWELRRKKRGMQAREAWAQALRWLVVLCMAVGTWSAIILLCVLIAGCSPAVRVIPAPAPALEPVPRPQRPAFVRYHDGDFLGCSVAARKRLLQRHAQTVWYMSELEAVVTAYERQTVSPVRAGGGQEGQHAQ